MSNKRKFWYLASPMSKFPGGPQKAMDAAAKEAALLMQGGVEVFCPATHTTPVETHIDFKNNNHDFWLARDRPFLDAAKGLIVCKLPGWKESFGVAWEIGYMTSRDKPIIYMEPGKVPGELKSSIWLAHWGDFVTSVSDESIDKALEEMSKPVEPPAGTRLGSKEADAFFNRRKATRRGPYEFKFGGMRGNLGVYDRRGRRKEDLELVPAAAPERRIADRRTTVKGSFGKLECPLRRNKNNERRKRA